MKKYVSKVVEQSKLPEFEGVSFTLRKLSHGTRTKLRMELAGALHKIRRITEDIQLEVIKHGLSPEEEPEAHEAAALPGARMLDGVDPGEAAGEVAKPAERKFSDEQLVAMDRMFDMGREIDAINADQVDPLYLKYCLVRVDGLTDEQGAVYTHETLYSDGPEDLCQEIIAAAKKLAGVGREDRENFESPTTSGAPVDGQTTHTIAPNANVTIITPRETAADTSPKE